MNDTPKAAAASPDDMLREARNDAKHWQAQFEAAHWERAEIRQALDASRAETEAVRADRDALAERVRESEAARDAAINGEIRAHNIRARAEEREREAEARATAAEAEVARLREALEWYADPQIYKPHPHGPAFDTFGRDLSFHARAALTPKQEKPDGE